MANVAQSAERLAERFFRRNPRRSFWVRSTLPEEFPGRPAYQVVLVIRAKGTFASVSVPLAGDIKAFPDNEVFLELLWDAVRAGSEARPGQEWQIDAATHLTMLKMAGVPVQEVPHV